MNINQAAKELEFRTGISRTLWFLLTASLATNMLLAIMAMSNKNTHRETLVPPSINKTFWVDGDKVSPEYLEQMGKFVLDLALNNTPLNCDTNRVALLKYVGSGSYGPINAQLSANCTLIMQNRLSNFFSVSNVIVKESERAVIYTGSMTRWLNDRRLPQRSGAYRLKFGYSGGRVYVQDLLEVDLRATDPFAEAAVKKDAIEEMQTEMAQESLSPNESIESRPVRSPASTTAPAAEVTTQGDR